MCELMDRPDLRDDPALATAPGRVARMLELDEAVTAWTQQRTRAQATAELQAAGVPGAALKTVAQLIEEELGRAIPMIQRNEREDRPATYTFGSPVRLGRHPARGAGPVPRLGEHNDAVFAELSSRQPLELTAAERQTGGQDAG
jgi:formyl-CoA transferase